MDDIANEIQATQIHDQISNIIPSIRTGCSDSEKKKKTVFVRHFLSSSLIQNCISALVHES